MNVIKYIIAVKHFQVYTDIQAKYLEYTRQKNEKYIHLIMILCI